MHRYCKCLFIICFIWIRLDATKAQKSCPRQESILPCRCLLRGEEYQIWCSHSDLPTVLDGLKAVGQYIKGPIDELIIENNYLPSLPGRTFFALKVLRLMLRYNGLERVSSDWLAGLQSSLLEIFIVEPQLRSLPDDSLSQLNALQAVTIQTNLLKRIPLFSSLPKLRYLQIESESLIELSPLNFKNNPQLEKLHISLSPKLTRLEANLLLDLPNLNLVNISHCGLNWVHPRALTGLPLLKELWLMNNKITDAGMIGRASRDLPHLEIIRLDNNYIDKLSEASFVDLPVLRKIYLSNNRITELHHGAFHRVPLVRSLDLNRNMLRRIHPESFLQNSGSGLEELSLVENDISHVSELRSLLDALPRLVFLDVSHNNLDAIPFGALRGHPTLEYINLDYNKLHIIDREAFMAMPALRELRLKNNSLSDILEPPLWNLPALKGLDLSGNFFKKIDPNFFNNLPSLRRIDLSRNQITIIDPTLFSPTVSLEHINISCNNLNVIHPATFRRLINLYELDISHNNLLEFVPGLPRGIEYLHLSHNKIPAIPILPSTDMDLPSLRMLDLSVNKIKEIPKASLITLPQLRRLHLGKNLLQSLGENCLAGLGRLESLDVQQNRIVHVHPNAFRETTELTEVNLRSNHLDILIPDIFKHTPVLKRLDISQNQLAEILPGTLNKNLELQILDASHNALVQLPPTFFGLKNLRVLDLRSNRIKNIDPEIISNLINLKELKLSENFIQELKTGTIHNLQYLKLLHLDNNELEFIEPNAIRALPSLKSIRLNRNKIKEIPNLAFNNLPALQIAELQQNEIRRIGPKAFHFVPHVLMLNLSHNQLTDLEDVGLRSLKSLEMLDVSNNRISRVASPSLEKMEWLVELRMDNNKICGVQGSAFNGMPRLRVLSLKNNKMMSFPENAVQRLRGNIAVLDIDGNPLGCDCNMLWLQAWLQESSQTGPRCGDGTLLREMPFSRQDCPETEQNAVTPGCDAELLSGPGTYTTAQVHSQWMDLKIYKNITRESLGTKNSLAPSPEESDYFYDEYVDYPYNESIAGSDQFVNEKLKDNEADTETITVKMPLNTKSPHYTPGDTPTIYAAAKNKTKKPSIPPKVNNSPSTSGFTFFGVPLSNINLNNLLGGGTGRMEAKLPSATLVAERKTAIVNNQGIGSARGNPGNMPSKLALNMQPPHRGMMQPPTRPEIQTGFVPILPGYGGFKPIPNPNLQQRPVSTMNIPNSPFDNPKAANGVIINPNLLPKTFNSSSQNENIKRQTILSEQPQLPKVSQNNSTPVLSQQFTTETVTSHSIKNTENNQSKPNPLTLSSRTTIDNKVKNLKTEIQVESRVKKENRSSFIETISVFVQELTTEVIEESTFIPEIETSTNIENIDNALTQQNNNIEPVLIITTEEPELVTTFRPKLFVGSAEIVTANITDIELGPKSNLNEKTVGSPLSELLVPGGQQQFKHGGRSTITKVPSPHILAKAPIKSGLETSSVSDPLPHREAKNSHEASVNSPLRIETSDEDTNWYFANYNKTNLEPYVARITNTSKGDSKFASHQCLQLILTIFYVNTILTLL